MVFVFIFFMQISKIASSRFLWLFSFYYFTVVSSNHLFLIVFFLLVFYIVVEVIFLSVKIEDGKRIELLPLLNNWKLNKNMQMMDLQNAKSVFIHVATLLSLNHNWWKIKPIKYPFTLYHFIGQSFQLNQSDAVLHATNATRNQNVHFDKECKVETSGFSLPIPFIIAMNSFWETIAFV